MRFAILTFTVLALTAAANGSPTPEVNEHEDRSLEPRVSLTNMVKINSAKDYCMIVPKYKRTNIGDSEYPGGMTTYCSKPKGAQGKLASNFWKKVAYKKGKGKTGKAFVQLTGCINTKTLDRLNPSDGGGQYDSSGGAGGKGNPKGSKCTGYAHYVELIEPDVNRACIRCCQEYKDCPLNRDTAGCLSVIPGNYFNCN